MDIILCFNNNIFRLDSSNGKRHIIGCTLVQWNILVFDMGYIYTGYHLKFNDWILWKGITKIEIRINNQTIY